MIFYLFLLFLCGYISLGAASVVELTDDSFENEIKSKSGDWFVKFYAPWCGHCKRMAPDFEALAAEEAAKGGASGLTVARVDCTSQKQICKRFKVRGYPSLRLIRDQGSAVYAYKGRSRNLDALREFITSGYKESTRMPFPSAANSDADASSAPVGNQQQQSPPSPPQQQQQQQPPPVVETGDSDSSSGKSLLWDAEGATGPDGRWDGTPGKSDLVRDLTATNYDRRTSDGTWLIQLCTSGVRACEFYRPTLERVASTMVGPDISNHVLVAAIDCQQQPSLCAQLSPGGQAEYPRLFVQADGQRWTYKGKRKHDDLVEFVSGAFMSYPRDGRNGGQQQQSDSQQPRQQQQQQKRQQQSTTTTTTPPPPPAQRAAVAAAKKRSALWDADGAPGPDGRWDGAPGPSDLVRHVTTQNFDQLVGQQTGTRWLVQFCLPELPPCMHYRATMDRLSRTVLAEGVKTTVIDCTLEPDLCSRFGAFANTVPLLVLVNNGQLYKWTGQRSHDQLAEWILGGFQSTQSLPLPKPGTKVSAPTPATASSASASASLPAASTDSAVTVLTTANMGSHISDGRGWLLEFYAPFCGHCKRLAPTWEIVAKKLKAEDGQRIGVGKIDCTVEKQLEQKFKIRGYPQIRFLTPEGKFFVYKGPRTEESLLAFARGDYLNSDRVFLDELAIESHPPLKKEDLKKEPVEPAVKTTKDSEPVQKREEKPTVVQKETVKIIEQQPQIIEQMRSSSFPVLDPMFVVVLVTCMLFLVLAALALGYTLGHAHGMASASIAVSLGNTPQQGSFFGTPVKSPYTPQQQGKKKKN